MTYTPYIILSAGTAAALQNLVTGSMNSGYAPVGGAQISGSVFIQTMMYQYSNTPNYLINPERLSKHFRSNVTASIYFNTSSGYQ